MSRNEKGQFGEKYPIDKHTDLYEAFAEWTYINTEKSSTIERLNAGVRVWLYWCEQNDVDPLLATESDVKAYIKWNLVNERAQTTITRRIGSVSKYYHHLKNDADAEWLIERNPTAEINLRRDFNIKNNAEYVRALHRDDRQDIISVSPEKIAKLADHVPGEKPETRTRNELIIRMLWATACRADELSRMRIDNIDWEKNEIRIRSSKLNFEDHPDLYHRKVWWDDNLTMLLRRWHDSHRSKFSKYAEADGELDENGKPLNRWEESPYLFLSTHGIQMKPSTISRIVKEAGFNADIQEPLLKDSDGTVKQWLYTAHRIRHSRITWLANDANNGEGMELNSLRMMAGHAKFDTTLDYVKSDWGTARERYKKAMKGHDLPV